MLKTAITFVASIPCMLLGLWNGIVLNHVAIITVSFGSLEETSKLASWVIVAGVAGNLALAIWALFRTIYAQNVSLYYAALSFCFAGAVVLADSNTQKDDLSVAAMFLLFGPAAIALLSVPKWLKLN
jgi:hypothetical protein